MAMVEYGGGIAAFHGSIGGTTFSKAGSMNIAKRRAYPRNRLIIERQVNRSRFSQCIFRWKNTLTNQQRDNWADAATSFSQSRHGVAYTITGMNLFTAVNTLLINIGYNFLDDPETYAGRLGIRTIIHGWNAITHKATIDFEPALEANEKLLVWSTNADRKFATYRKLPYRNKHIIVVETELPVDMDAQYRAADGTIHYHFIVLDILGAMSSPFKSYYQYTYS